MSDENAEKSKHRKECLVLRLLKPHNGCIVGGGGGGGGGSGPPPPKKKKKSDA